MTKVSVPVVVAGGTKRHAFIEPDYYAEVESWPTGVKGLAVTQSVQGGSPNEGRWVLTHTPSGRSLGYEFSSIAAARRAAEAIVDLFDWTDSELLWDLQKPSRKPAIQQAARLLAAEGRYVP